MDYITKFKWQVTLRGIFGFLLPLTISLVMWYVLAEVFAIGSTLSLIISVGVYIVTSIATIVIMVHASIEPILTLERVISYAGHSNRSSTPPDMDHIKLGKELITAQSHAIYDLAATPATNTAQPTAATQETTQSVGPSVENTLLNRVSTPVIGISSDQTITVANKAAADYIGSSLDQMIGAKLYDRLIMSFQGEETFEEWLKKTQAGSVTDSARWERVKHSIDDDHSKQFDMLASFSKGDSTGTETMLALFDQTQQYTRDDQEISFVALAVHELRTPLTIMRGYIEVFEDELGPSLSPELAEFMHKMHASAQQLTAFVGNILNVARVEENQLALKLRQEDWDSILRTAVSDLELRARVHGMHIELQVAENLPAVAADRVSLHEVINNLVDNALKYSGKGEKIVIKAELNDQGLIETSVQDFGIGIPTAVMGQLFQKFHRSHKSKVQVGGTGLGLYLCKALVTAHGGNIWVRSKEGEGSIFSFTILPYDSLSDEEKSGEDGIIRGAHGWIKNHSLYRS